MAESDLDRIVRETRSILDAPPPTTLWRCSLRLGPGRQVRELRGWYRVPRPEAER